MILVDYKSTTLRTNPSISVARKVLTILQHHYVETLGRALVVNLPTILSFFYKGIAPFLDPVTREKMRFNPDMFELVPREQLDADFGGDYKFEFDHEVYWNQLVEYVSHHFRFISTRKTAWSSRLVKIVRACGIAPDGTRITTAKPKLASSLATQLSDIPTSKNHSPTYVCFVSYCPRSYLNCCRSATVVGTPDDKSIIRSHQEITLNTVTTLPAT